uniref:Cytosol aminopeptidase n=1 Tax=Trichuris muris TaxID=70415 RepID=A0A5S6QFZ6_TRIMR
MKKQLAVEQLLTRYNREPEFALSARMIISLAFVPIPELDVAAAALLDVLPVELRNTFQWFRRTYIGILNRSGKRLPAMFPPRMWSTYRRTVVGSNRTNNYAEAAHRRLRSEFGVEHPTLWRFIDGLRKVQSGQDNMYEEYVRGEHPRYKRAKYIRADRRILDLVGHVAEKIVVFYLAAWLSRKLLFVQFIIYSCPSLRLLVKSSTSVKSACLFRTSFKSMASVRNGLILGTFLPEPGTHIDMEKLTFAAKSFNGETGGQFFCTKIETGQARVVCGLGEKYGFVAAVGLGKIGQGYVESEQLDEGRESVRNAIAAGAIALRDVGVTEVFVDPCGFADAAAEGAFLSTFAFDELKSKPEDRKPAISFHLYNAGQPVSQFEELWQRGKMFASGQNLVRRLADMPANMMTPVRFAKFAGEKLSCHPNVQVIMRDQRWAEEMKMGAFLSVAKGSVEVPVFLEVHLKSKMNKNPPVCLVGKGVCFDSGGVSLKPSDFMASMRADMTGAACVLSTIDTLAKLGTELPFDIIGLMPLVENMPGGKASKPGDVVYAMNGKSIEIDNTDAEGRLILADALCYADSFNPSVVIDIATLTGSIGVALGCAATGVFSNCDSLWQQMSDAGKVTGDRVWRMPLFKHYSECIVSNVADLCNTNKSAFKGMAGSCTAAAFLQEFTLCKSWMHMDIAGVMERKAEQQLFNSNMTGRPLRTLVHCIEKLSQQTDASVRQ